MSKNDIGSPLVPDFDIVIDGKSVAARLAGCVAELRVDDDISLPGSFAIELAAQSQAQVLEWLDDERLFALGGRVQMRLGYAGAVASVMSGQITALEPEFGSDHAPRLLVRGYDERHRLQRGRRTHTYIDSTDTEIAEKVASRAGLKLAAAPASRIKHTYLLQANQTDMEFLQQRAAAIGYELLAREGRLLFRPRAHGEAAVATLALGYELLDFAPLLSMAQQVSEVEVRAWNIDDKKVFVATQKPGDEATRMQGSGAAALVKERFGAAVEHIGDVPLASREEADALARARHTGAALGLVTAEARCIGRHDLKPGVVVKIDGVGQRFGGPYYLVSVQHRYTPSSGYHTRLSARRNAL